LSGANVAEGDDDILYKGVRAVGREKLTANRTYYVRTDGNDANDGLADTAGRAFLTIQKAVDTTYLLDLNGFVVTIQVGDGTWTENVTVSNPFVGSDSAGGVVLQGNVATPSSCVWSPAAGSCLAVSYAKLTVQGFKASGIATLFSLNQRAVISFGIMDFGSAGSGTQIAIASGAMAFLTVAYTISGGAASHITCVGNGFCSVGNFTITLTGTPAFSTAFVGAIRSLGAIFFLSTVFSGSATGKRYEMSSNSNLASNASGYVDWDSYLPGDAQGTIKTSFHTNPAWKNLLINPTGRVQDGASGAIGDGTYGLHNCWYLLLQTGNGTPTTITDVQDGVPSMIRLTQNNAGAQRFGYAQILEGMNCKHLRGRQVTLSGLARCSASSVNLRYAVLEWTSTEDAPTKDVVLSWTSGTFTAGNFFLAANLNVLGAGTTTLTANVLKNFLSDAIQLGSTFNNLIVFLWTSATLAQNGTLDLMVQLEEGESYSRFDRRAITIDRRLSERYEQRKTVQTQNGSRHIPLVKMRATPIITPSVGSAASATPDGFELSHTAAAACDVLADARLGV
jgi:hypothetical protein